MIDKINQIITFGNELSISNFITGPGSFLNGVSRDVTKKRLSIFVNDHSNTKKMRDGYKDLISKAFNRLSYNEFSDEDLERYYGAVFDINFLSWTNAFDQLINDKESKGIPLKDSITDIFIKNFKSELKVSNTYKISKKYIIENKNYYINISKSGQEFLRDIIYCVIDDLEQDQTIKEYINSGGDFLLFVYCRSIYKKLQSNFAKYESICMDNYYLECEVNAYSKHQEFTKRNLNKTIIKKPNSLINTQIINVSNDAIKSDNFDYINNSLFNEINNLLGGTISDEYISKIKRIIKNKGFVKLKNIIEIISDEEVRNNFINLMIDNKIPVKNDLEIKKSQTRDQIIEDIYQNLSNDILSDLKIESTDDLVLHLLDLGYIDSDKVQALKKSISVQLTEKHIFKILKTLDGTINFEGKGSSVYGYQIFVIEIGKAGRLLFHQKDIMYFDDSATGHDSYDLRIHKNKKWS